jgi:phospholipid/cholesterol/gamma-HCH transport system substrate-binding protein
MKRSDNITWAQVRVGVFIVCALLFLAGGIVLMGKKTKFFSSTGTLSIIMKDVAGLKVGAPAWLAGIDVGVVTRLGFENPEKNNEVEIVLEIDEESLKKIGADSIVTIKTRGLMGEKYVDITPSATFSANPPRRLMGVQTVRLEDVMKKADTSFQMLNGIIGRINQGEGTFGRFTKDPKLYDNLVVLSRQLNRVVLDINAGKGTIGKLVGSSEPYDRLINILERADRTLKDIQASDGTMNRLIHDRQLYDKLVLLADKSVQAAEDVRALNRKIMSPDGTVGLLITDRGLYDKATNLFTRADTSLKSLEEVTGRINRGEGTAGKLVSDKELYDKMNKMVNSVDELVNDIKKNPGRYVKFSVF